MKTSGLIAALSFLLLTGCNDSPTPDQSRMRQTSAAARGAQKPIDVSAINKATRKFYLLEGRFPTNLMELALQDYIPFVPVLPAGLSWAYDTNTGIASVIKEAAQE
jgi:hypothetical protein